VTTARRTLIIPGLQVDEGQFELVAAALGEHAPDVALTWERFTDPMAWCLVPDPEGEVFKAEMLIVQTQPRTIKLNIWHAPDLRDNVGPRPHSHPWSKFRGLILAGGYEEDRYTEASGTVTRETRTYEAGDVNTVKHAEYHEVTRILEPGRTLSLMLCDEGVRGAWGYLDPQTAEFRFNDPADHTRFTQLFRVLNPHLA
jgi:hypothetical protein